MGAISFELASFKLEVAPATRREAMELLKRSWCDAVVILSIVCGCLGGVGLRKVKGKESRVEPQKGGEISLSLSIHRGQFGE